MTAEPSRGGRLVQRVRGLAARELVQLGARTATVEEAVAENRVLRPHLERVLAQAEADVARFRGVPAGSLHTDPHPQHPSPGKERHRGPTV